MNAGASGSASGSRFAMQCDFAVADTLLLFVMFGVAVGGSDTGSGPTRGGWIEMKGSEFASTLRLAMSMMS